MRRHVYGTIILGMTLLSLACGGDAGGPEAIYENITGSYSGRMIGVSQGVGLDALFSLSLSQSSGDVNGTYALQGGLSDGVTALDVQGTGTITGTLGAGNNPSINLTVQPGSCPNNRATFSGTYDVANRRITMVGPVEFFGTNCSVVLRYQMNVVLTR
jgi:hypothetical protein